MHGGFQFKFHIGLTGTDPYFSDQHIVDNQVEITGGLQRAMDETQESFGMDPKERFWSQAVAFTLYGGMLAKRAGLIDFHPERIRPWLLRETRRMRGTLSDSAVGAVQVLADYLNEHIGERLVVTTVNKQYGAATQRPNRELSSRYEPDTHTLWISRSHVRAALEVKHHDYTKIKDELVQRGVLLDDRAKKVLGAGTDQTGGQTTCWKIDTLHADLVGVV